MKSRPRHTCRSNKFTLEAGACRLFENCSQNNCKELFEKNELVSLGFLETMHKAPIYNLFVYAYKYIFNTYVYTHIEPHICIYIYIGYWHVSIISLFVCMCTCIYSCRL